MLRNVFILLLLVPLTAYSQNCYELNKGKGLSLFSPFLNDNPRSKAQIEGARFGDSSQTGGCGGVQCRWVVGVYNFSKPEPIFAIHSGIVTIYTTSSFVENNQANDALWINGDSITSSYMGIIPNVASGQFVYAGQQIGKVLIDANLNNNFALGIRRAPPFNPYHKRGYLPAKPDANGKCECNTEPVWPEYFVNPASKYVAYDRYNEILPQTSLKININPGGVGKWSFDNGTTWLSGGTKIIGLPFGHYKIIFKNDFGYTSPSPILVNTNNFNKDFETGASYIPDYTIIKKPDAELQRETDKKQIESKLAYAMDSLSMAVHADDKADLLKNTIIDSLNSRFKKIEAIQQETLFFTRLFRYILPILALALAFITILFFQNNKIRKQKKHLENLQKEQHHRVHNSLGVVSSLINKYKDDITPEKLANIDNSIIAISTVHRQLYKGNDFENINFQPIAENISQSLLAQRDIENYVEAHIHANIVIPKKQSTTLALMFNELFTNSLKYAFDNTEARNIFLSVAKEESHTLVIYRDNGKGYNMDFLEQKTSGFGRVLLEGLSNQLRAKINFYNENGACCMIKF